MLEGQCHCGAIRYGCEGEPVYHALCHCGDCRRHAGAPVVGWALFREREFRRSSTASPRSMLVSENGRRHFCADCGTGLFYTNEPVFPNMTDIQSGTLDDPGALPAQIHVQTAERIGWMKDIRLAAPVRALSGARLSRANAFQRFIDRSERPASGDELIARAPVNLPNPLLEETEMTLRIKLLAAAAAVAIAGCSGERPDRRRPPPTPPPATGTQATTPPTGCHRPRRPPPRRLPTPRTAPPRRRTRPRSEPSRPPTRSRRTPRPRYAAKPATQAQATPPATTQPPTGTPAAEAQTQAATQAQTTAQPSTQPQPSAPAQANAQASAQASPVSAAAPTDLAAGVDGPRPGRRHGRHDRIGRRDRRGGLHRHGARQAAAGQLRPQRQGLVIAMTKAQLEAAVAAQRAATPTPGG